MDTMSGATNGKRQGPVRLVLEMATGTAGYLRLPADKTWGIAVGTGTRDGHAISRKNRHPKEV